MTKDEAIIDAALHLDPEVRISKHDYVLLDPDDNNGPLLCTVCGYVSFPGDPPKDTGCDAVDIGA